MRVYVANFGLENYEWPRCRENNVVATMQDERVHAFWQAGDRAAYIDYAIRNLKTARGIAPIPAVAGRWFNLGSIIVGSEDDLWLHRDGDMLWWTITNKDPATITLEPDLRPKAWGSPDVYYYRKPCQPWACHDRRGRRLEWKGLHPKSHDFFATEATLQQLSERYAGYALAIVNGDDLTPWHSLPEWQAKQANRPGAARNFNAREVTIAEMVRNAQYTASSANGQSRVRIVKNKDFRFAGPREAEAYVDALYDAQGGLCAISELPMQLSGGDDHEMRCSLDRIDSNGHYEPGNVQIVCRFVNRWKGASDDAEFRRLMEIIRIAI
ncbi:hypothetical protein KZ813_15235 [Sphingomonas sp. RHCKR7]|uniref:hypothetical protein n=1 Tax=Sphingomonas folli TaxID=2862497 RepID=UPI001CA5B11E|nr:hypothetical protein [Sphingomonas folli]MBW6528196.1 hypothetical protein [Sphingomonas folli]